MMPREQPLLILPLSIWLVLVLRRMWRRNYAMPLLLVTRGGDDGVVIARHEMMEQPRIDGRAPFARRGGVGDLLSVVIVGCHILFTWIGIGRGEWPM